MDDVSRGGSLNWDGENLTAYRGLGIDGILAAYWHGGATGARVGVYKSDSTWGGHPGGDLC